MFSKLCPFRSKLERDIVVAYEVGSLRTNHQYLRPTKGESHVLFDETVVGHSRGRSCFGVYVKHAYGLSIVSECIVVCSWKANSGVATEGECVIVVLVS